MFCPHCGADSQKPDAYCTRCGTWLLDHTAVARHGRRIPHTARSPEQKLRAVLVFNVLDTLLALFAFVALMLNLHPNPHWTFIMGLAFSLIIAVHQAVSFKFNMELRARLKRGRDEARAGPAESLVGGLDSAATRALPTGEGTQYAAPLSVTENTTELLERVPRERRERQ